MTQVGAKRTSITVTLVAVFAALYVVLSILPGIPVVGLPEMKIELEAAVASVFGIVLGPYLGALAAFIGTIAAFFYHGASVFDVIFIFNPALNAFIIGLIFRKKWKIAFVMLAVIIAAFWFTPVATPMNENWYVALVATFDKIVALLLIIPIATVRVEKAKYEYLTGSFLLVLVASFIGNEADSALGNVLFALPPVYEGIFGIPHVGIVRGLFVVSPFVYPIIRFLQALIATWIGLPLIRAFKALKVQVWP